jgi:arginine decarboxylase
MTETIPSPYPNGAKIGNDLSVRDGRLFFHTVDLVRLITETLPGLDAPLGTPLEIVYLPKIISQIKTMKRWFAEASAKIGYSAGFEYAFASKANSSEEVTRTALAGGAHYETSSAADVDIVRYCLDHDLMPHDRMTINNGFKVPGSDYAEHIIALRADGYENIIPVIEDEDELQPFIDSGLSFKIGLRQKIDKFARDIDGIARADIRFGMHRSAMHRVARRITDAPNLELVMYHAMQGDAAADTDGWLAGFEASMHVYAELARAYPTLTMYNWGGGFPARVGDLANFDYPGFITRLLTIAQNVSTLVGIPAPVMVGEYGRYTTAEHGFHFFRVLKAKENHSALPWYLIDGSVMSSFPDAWALGLEFLVLPLNHLDRPFRQVRLGGLTCDSDDIYPTRPEHDPLFLPVTTDDLYIGFFGVGCYQEILGGIGGVKHCLLPEANELIITSQPNGDLQYEVLPGQSYDEILKILGYGRRGRRL